MLITPAELKGYSEFDVVKERSDDKLEKDILEAVVYIESIVGHDFSEDKYDPLPEKAKLAALKTAQYYALVNSDESIAKGYKSEKIGDYSYTLADGNTIYRPDIFNLLKGYIDSGQVEGGSTRLRMRSL